jgi:S-adenosylmethionine synthetase
MGGEDPVRVLVIGASGMLGRALLRELEGEPRFTVVGTAKSRVTPNLRTLDLNDTSAVRKLMDECAPAIVVNCAAERDPDRASKDPEGTRKLNVDGAGNIARVCADVGASIIQLSTDYVFDGGVHTGVFPPYDVDAPPHPLNLYAETKLASEAAVLGVPGARALVVRVPVLYARDSESLSESASLVVAEKLLDTSAGAVVDDWGMRFPTLVDDAAVVLRKLIALKAAGGADAAQGVLHVSSPHCVTKYQLAMLMARILGVSGAHLSADAQAPKGEPRPRNTQLDCARTWAVLGEVHAFCALETGISLALERFRSKFVGA